jgi:hypothetical protein
MEEFVVEVTPEMAVLVVIVGAILQVAKRIKALDKLKQWFPFLAIGVAYALATLSGDTENIVMASVVVGLVASGGYDLIKGTTK